MLNDLRFSHIHFKSPPASFRPQPLWVWNGKVSETRITEMLEAFHQQGIGGVFVHPRPGLVTEYLSEEWFRLWGFALEKCKSLGLECHIYDENSYPSGFAGGHVPSNNPHVIAQDISLVRVEDASFTLDRGQSYFGVFEKTADGKLIESDKGVDQASDTNPLWALLLRAASPSLWQAGFPAVDMTLSETTRDFLRLTHARYAEHFSDAFGKTIKYAFADEPTVSRGEGRLPLSLTLLREFRRDHGYELQSRLLDLFQDSVDSCATRFDYWKTVNRLFLCNYVKQTYDWCELNGLEFTGHYHESNWPDPAMQPSAMAAYRWMQAPAIDLLAFQFTPNEPDLNAVYIMCAWEVRSVANQFDRPRILTESCGGGGYEMGPAEFKPLEDLLLACGINLITPHLSHQTLAGSRKYDWPQTISSQAPWWEAYHEQANHVGRTAYALTRGQEMNRVLVLQPTTSGWMHRGHAFKGSFEKLQDHMRELHLRFCMDLHQAGIDFDLGDETVLAEDGSVSQGKLRIGKRYYDLVVISPAMLNICSETIELLRDSAIPIAGLQGMKGQLGRVDGRESDLVWLKELRNRLMLDVAALIDEISTRVAPRIQFADVEASGPLLWFRLEGADENFWFISNPWSQPAKAELCLQDLNLIELDTERGFLSSMDAVEVDGFSFFSLKIKPGGHLLLRSGDLSGLEIQEKKSDLKEVKKSVQLDFIKATPDTANMLVLDYCDYHPDFGEGKTQIPTLHADKVHWNAMGFPQNLWQVSVQFRKSFFEFPPKEDSGFEITYRFVCNEGIQAETLNSLHFAVERPWLYTMACNGQTLKAGEPWFDEEMRAFPLIGKVKPGENRITLRAEEWHPLHEIMPAYVRGDFSLCSFEEGFKIIDVSALDLGDWTRQGRPFYPDGVKYSFDVTLEQDCHFIEVSLADWKGAAAQVCMGEISSWVRNSPDVCTLTGNFKAGKHQLSIRVIGNFKNQMGPYFCEGLPGHWSWEQCPKTQPHGESYGFVSSGLFASPEISILGVVSKP